MSLIKNFPSGQEFSINSQINPSMNDEFRISMILQELMKGSWGVDFASPIEQELTEGKDFKVLDVGCGGSATWLLQLSEDYPLTKFVGVDILPTFPKDFSQNNLQFVQGDVLNGLPFEDNYFDFVHMGFLLTVFTEEEWEEKVIKELVRVCKPGGWVELLDIEEAKSLGPNSKRLVTSFMNHLEYNGCYNILNVLDDIPEFLYATNQVNKIYADERLIPIGKWGGELGKLALELFIIIFRKLIPSNRIGISEEEHKMMIIQYEKEVEYYRSYFISLRIFCQKA